MRKTVRDKKIEKEFYGCLGASYKIGGRLYGDVVSLGLTEPESKAWPGRLAQLICEASPRLFDQAKRTAKHYKKRVNWATFRLKFQWMPLLKD